MSNNRILIETVKYLGEEKNIYSENCISIKLNHIELKKLIDACNETGYNMSGVIRLHTQKCCKCGCTNIQYYDKETESLKEFKRTSFLSKRKRNYFTKKRS